MHWGPQTRDAGQASRGFHGGRCTQMLSAHVRDDSEEVVPLQFLDLNQRLNSTCKADRVLYGPAAGSRDSAAATKMDPPRMKCPGRVPAKSANTHHTVCTASQVQH